MLTPLAVWFSMSSQSGHVLYQDGTVHNARLRGHDVIDITTHDRSFTLEYLETIFGYFYMGDESVPGWVLAYRMGLPIHLPTFEGLQLFNDHYYTGNRLRWPDPAPSLAPLPEAAQAELRNMVFVNYDAAGGEVRIAAPRRRSHGRLRAVDDPVQPHKERFQWLSA